MSCLRKNIGQGIRLVIPSILVLSLLTVGTPASANPATGKHPRRTVSHTSVGHAHRRSEIQCVFRPQVPPVEQGRWQNRQLHDPRFGVGTRHG